MVPLVEVDGEIVSSTHIRGLVVAGDLEQANRFLGSPFQLRGTVAARRRARARARLPDRQPRARQRARLPQQRRLRLPRRGRGRTASGAGGRPPTNVGVRPTFVTGRGVLVEAYLLDFDGDLYDRELRLAFLARLRGERRFDTRRRARRADAPRRRGRARPSRPERRPVRAGHSSAERLSAGCPGNDEQLAHRCRSLRPGARRRARARRCAQPATRSLEAASAGAGARRAAASARPTWRSSSNGHRSAARRLAARRAQGRPGAFTHRGRARRRAEQMPVAAAQDCCAAAPHDVLSSRSSRAELLARVRAAARTKRLQEELVGQGRRLETMLHEDPLTRPVQPPLRPHPARRADQRRPPPRPPALGRDDRHRPLQAPQRRPRPRRRRRRAGRRSTTALRDRLRAEDELGRLGGEEFLALLPDADAEAAAARGRGPARQRRGGASAHCEPALAVTVSVGWATLGRRGGADALVKRADKALLRGQAAGRNTVRGAENLSASLPRRT